MPRDDDSRPAPSSRRSTLHQLIVAGAAFATLAFPCAAARPARAEEVWSVGSGRVIFNFNVPLLRDLGIDLAVQGNPLPDQDDLLIGDPRWAFPIRPGSDFKFRAEYGRALPGGSVGGSLYLNASITLSDRKSGAKSRLTDLEIVQAPGPASNATAAEDGPPIVLRSRSTGVVFCQLVSSMFDLRPKDRAIRIHYLNARISREWAVAFGRPELAGWVIGMGEVRGDVNMLSSTPPTQAPYQPVFAGGVKDVSLGALANVQQVGRIGTFPTGTVALAMSTTSCNVGTVDVPWLAPMQTDHPMIHMALYRLLDGRFEQVGVSWLKHGFFALSNSQCTPCENASDGSYLAIGCSDTYGVSNNQDRNYLGPREEVNPYTGIWNCVGSHFSGGPAFPDCVRRHGSSGHDAVEHRLVVTDADLGNPGATYYYEAYYIVRDDESLHNNWGSRVCTMSRSGSTWNLSTPGLGTNPLINGPALERWGELRTEVDVAAGDGQVLLAVQTTDLGGGMYHYEYSLLNKNSDREIQSFNIPVAGVNNITNIGFHDNDADPANDWQVSVDPAKIRWETESYEVNPEAEALEFGYMVNFRFDADAPPSDVDARLGIFKPGPESEVAAATRGPFNSVTAVGDPIEAHTPRLIGIRPNPTNRQTSISFELPSAGSVKLEIFDAAGRLVRSVLNENRGAGAHQALWDGKSASGSRVTAGVYYARLQTASITIARPIVMLK